MEYTRSKSDIVSFLEPLEEELRQFLLDYGYPAIPEFWEAYDAAMLELREIAPVGERPWWGCENPHLGVIAHCGHNLLVGQGLQPLRESVCAKRHRCCRPIWLCLH